LRPPLSGCVLARRLGTGRLNLGPQSLSRRPEGKFLGVRPAAPDRRDLSIRYRPCARIGGRKTICGGPKLSFAGLPHIQWAAHAGRSDINERRTQRTSVSTLASASSPRGSPSRSTTGLLDCLGVCHVTSASAHGVLAFRRRRDPRALRTLEAYLGMENP